MRLIDVLTAEFPLTRGPGDIQIVGVTSSSAQAGPGYLFAGLPGTKVDGASFAADALARGASAILVGRGKTAAVPDGVPLIEADNPRRALALIAARLAGRQPDVAVAVTGTSGKTSVADFTRQIFTTLGRSAASVGTIGIVKPSGAVYGSLTTPDPVSLHATLAGLADEGVTHLSFEASSHGLDQNRLDGVRLTAAAFTNLGRDHLDYHRSADAYLEAKLRLFTELLEPGQTAVVNADGPGADRVSAECRARDLKVLSVGASGESINLVRRSREGFLQALFLRAGVRDYVVRLPLVGAYQSENALVAAGLAIAAGEDAGAAIDALATLKGVPGRLEIIGECNGGLAIVDYAHKPEALAAALDGCRPFATGRLISVFGCGGDRDKGKRPIMGAISVEKADVTIVTDDNPRSERSAAIRAEILGGAKGAIEIGDRAEAILTAIRMLQPGDVVVVAGKGHETGQTIGDRVIPFSDAEEIRRAINAEARR